MGMQVKPDAVPVESEDVDSLLARLRRVEGQIRGIQRMLEEDRVCEDIVTQLMAARSSLDQVGVRLLEHHIDRCICSDASPEQAARDMQQALKLWMRMGAPQNRE
ncbi:MAG TPA: metal-sensitive transcriptional regulator [Dehalococcoidia bacterium]|nr:metal-sensitive transcriptional regulator [Dehalococcoidia bacterium]